MSRPDDNQRIDLTELGNARRWDAMLDKAVSIVPMSALNEFESRFLKDMLARNENDRPMWSPTRKQWNMLHTLIQGW